MKVLMVGVDKNRIGGMWTVSNIFISNERFNKEVDLMYVATSTCGSALKRFLKMMEGYLKVLFYLSFKKIDVVHVHMAEKGSTFRKGWIVKVAKKFRKKTIVQLHAGPFMNWYNNVSIKKQNSIKSFFDNADCVLVLGEFWKKQLAELTDVNKIKVLYNGMYSSERNKYNPEGKYIVYMGLIKQSKGVYDLLDAVKDIDGELTDDIKVMLCGHDEEGRIEYEIQSRGLNNRVKMVGWVHDEEKEQILSNACVCVLPSYFEALSMTVIESMCYGIPIITTNISTMNELLGDKVPLIEPGDINGLASMLLEWTNNKALRLDISDYLYLRGKTFFSVENNIDNTLKIYKLMCDVE